MKLEGFIGPAYTLDSVNVDAQRCVNLYPEAIESGRGKEAQVAFLRSTPGLEEILEVGNGPIRLLHVDSIGRIFAVSGAKIYSLSKKASWRYQFIVAAVTAKSFASANVTHGADTITITTHGFFTGLKVRLTGTSGTIPVPLAVSTDYYVIRIDANTVKLAVSLDDAIAGTPIDLTSDGVVFTGTLTPQDYDSLYNVKHSDINFSFDTFSKTAHGLLAGHTVELRTSGLYATGVTPDTTYYITNTTADTFQLASSFANALAGTAIALTDVADAWNAKALGALGEYGGASISLASSTGAVKAASMSLGGNGTDSSTMFVDGSNNYLLQDDEGAQTLGVLGSSDYAQAVINITNDITLTTLVDVDEHVSSDGITVSDLETSDVDIIGPGSEGLIFLSFYKDVVNATGVVSYGLDIIRYTGETLTSAELVTAISTGVVSGKDIIWGDVQISAPGVGVTRTDLNYTDYAASGGGSQLSSSAFGTPVQADFTRETTVGEGFGSVPTATQIVWSDGFFIVNQANTNKFYVSGLQDFEIDTLDFTSSEGSPDLVLALAVVNRTLYVLNELTTEVYSNTGNADFPFERVGGGFIEIGTLAANSVAQGADTLFWLGRSKEGQGSVYAMSGASPRRISTHAIERAIAGYASPEDATAYVYTRGGHTFYALNFAEATWVYDLATGLWHERAYTNAGTLERHRVECVAYVPQTGLLLGSDYETSEIYLIKEDVYSDNTDAITRLRSSPHMSSGLSRVFYSKFQLDMETGIGLDGDVQGSEPTVMLDWSDDGGHTWSSESWALADAGGGDIGDYSKRVIWRRLGKSRDRIWRVKITDPVKVVLIGAHIDAQAGAS